MSDATPLSLSKTVIHNYLTSLYKTPLEVQRVWRLGEKPEDSGDLKGFGYGFPYVIEFKMGSESKRVVLETMRPGGFGHDHFSDRAQVLIWQNAAFNGLPKHVHSVDVGAFEEGSNLKSLGKCFEFFIVTEFIEGKLYHLDLDRIKETGQLTAQDEERCLALSDYLVKIHKRKNPDGSLYIRRIRDLVGHGECIMGLLDSYPKEFNSAQPSYLIDVEKACVDWRWRLKEKPQRLSQVHGDFHPWNLLFREGADFTVLDRSRGEWGEPADDIAALTINYLFYSVQKYGELKGPFERLFRLFWDNYLRKSEDHEILNVVQPFFAWRGLVVASPVWYPQLSEDVRVKLLNFVKNILQYDHFDLVDVNSYLNSSK
ncbi:MAG: aminoglycoside phosphotransferase family protein [Candidatus Bathyarchaeota archaeon]|nr:aminoglycoside phosphotransferase family protein [Candidatus Bathyarchaeota archaeon]